MAGASAKRETSDCALYDTMASAAGVSSEPLYAADRPGDLRRSAVDAALAGEHLGWRPVTALPSGIAKTIDWFRARD